MATAGATGRFYLAGLRSLRSAEGEALTQIDSVWNALNNDQFYDFAQYVNIFTGFALKGYRMADRPGAFEACMRTLDALEELSSRMNQSTTLLEIGDAVTTKSQSRDISQGDMDAAWDAIGTGVDATSPIGRLLQYVREQFDGWASGVADNFSEMIQFGTAPVEQDLEVALSGGGMRAAAFSLGVLMYLFDVGASARLRQISSVSGGSITNGFMANLISEQNGITDEGVGEFARRLAAQGIPLEKTGRRFGWMVILTALMFAMAFGSVSAVALGLDKSWLVVAVFGFVVGIGWGVVSYRAVFALIDVLVGGWFAVILNHMKVESVSMSFLDFLRLKHLQSKLSSAGGLTRRLLRDIKSPVTHVFTATDLRHGEHFHLSQHWATSNTFGPTDPGDVRVDEAVRASAAFPGALPPVNIALDRLNLPPHLIVGVRQLQLVDGGVRDNIGHVFQSQLLGDSPAQRATLTRYGSTRSLIVADASAPRGIADLSESAFASVPVLRRIGQLVTFPRVLSIMNQSNSEARALALKMRLDGDGNGFVVSIHDSPVAVCLNTIADEAVSSRLLRGGRGSGHTDSREQRAETVLRALVRIDESAESQWNGDCYLNQTVPTTLDGLGAHRVETLIRHGYVLTMCRAHIAFGWPLAPDRCWTKERFSTLLTEAAKPDHAGITR